jgi:membrane protease YdiL (CAAX protease family)
MLTRLLHHPLLRVFIGFIWVTLATVAVQTPITLLAGNSAWLRLLGALLVAAAALLAYVVFVRVLERRLPVAELALGPAPRELAAGAALGVVLFSLTLGLIAALGYYRIAGVNPWTAMLPTLTLSVISGVVEEVIFRGLVFRIAQQSLGTWLALLLSGLIFGLVHVLNPNASLLAALAIALEAGLLLGAAYLVTGRLWLPIGLHFAWNFTQGGVFGVAVSGNTVPGLLAGRLDGPAPLTGGAFGAEASIIAVLVCSLATAALLWQAQRRGLIVPAPWRRSSSPTALGVP